MSAKRLANLHELPRASDSGFDEAVLAARGNALAVKRRAITRYAITDEELSLGMVSLATPVINAAGEIIAAMSVSAFTARITLKEMIKTFLPVLVRQAERLGRAL